MRTAAAAAAATATATTAAKALEPLIFRSFAQYRAWRNTITSTIGFVPTMGALHAGHLSLARQAARENSKVVLSIFVNPAQFAPHEDLDKYPRPFESDLAKIRESGVVDILLLPSASDLYPSGIVQDVTHQTGAFVTVLGLSHQLEGSIRPTFFRGVATVLAKFLNVVRPTVLYLGQKDIQQSIVVRRMMRDLCFDAHLAVGETVREPDGLAMSSRNVYLDTANRARAPCLIRALRAAETAYRDAGERDCAKMKHAAQCVLDAEEGVEVEYLSVADTETLDELDVLRTGQQAVISGAVRLGRTRILDNIIIGIT